MKRIINNALDALVNLDEKEDGSSQTEGVSELSRREATEEMRSTHYRQQTDAAVSKKEDFLTGEIKELEKILEFADYNNKQKAMSKKEDLILAARQLSEQVKKDEMAKRQQKQQQQRREIESLSRRKDAKKMASSAEEKNTKSREEKAGVVIDNNNIRDLVDLVVRAIDDEARRDEEEKNSGKNVNEVSESVDGDVNKFIKEAKVTTSTDNDDQKEKKSIEKETDEVEEEHKSETVKDDENTKTLCNTRKRECVEMKKDLREETAKSAIAADNSKKEDAKIEKKTCLLYTSPSPRDRG